MPVESQGAPGHAPDTGQPPAQWSGQLKASEANGVMGTVVEFT